MSFERTGFQKSVLNGPTHVDNHVLQPLSIILGGILGKPNCVPISDLFDPTKRFMAEPLGINL